MGHKLRPTMGKPSLNSTSKFAVFDPPGFKQPAIDVNDEQSTPTPSKAAPGREKDRLTESTKASMSGNVKIGGDFTKTPNPQWLKDRDEVYKKVKERRTKEIEGKMNSPITVVMPDGTEKTACKDGSPFVSWKTTPYDVAVSISQGLADSVVVALITWSGDKIDYIADEVGDAAVDTMADAMEGQAEDEEAVNAINKPELWDMTRPLVGNVGRMEFLKFGDEKAKMVFWHSSAHMLGEALEHLYGGYLTIGPPVKSGFYYDMYVGSEVLTEEDYKKIDTEVSKQIIKKKQKFERMVVTKDEAMEMFKYNPFKSEIIRTKVPDGTRTTVYRCGDLIDLCRGPHVRHTGQVKSMKCINHSATQWLAKEGNDQLQRMYGVSFPDKAMMKVWEENREKARERDHRIIGEKQKL
ncbi:hypothetical protein TrRE_jg125, partial [Triparma retinervis]